jgi:DNA invertase Pin-like site-specific DNA recombinase
MSQRALTKRVAQRAADVKRAIIYLRVSSAGQVNTDYDPEGLSIPAQRKACHAKAADLGTVVVDEYVEPGRSATNTDKRPRFMEMMARIKAERDVDLVIVYARSRLHRNVEDAAITRASLRKLGVQLVSVMDYTDDSYIGDLVATIIDGVNEYQSRASGADIRYKMAAKARNGGTVSYAKIGYLNIHEEVDGRKVATVITDPERAPFIKLAFELYATGKHTFASLHAALTEAGLRTRPTPKRSARPVSKNMLCRILRDRYYLGVITYDGKEYPGRHEPLITQKQYDKAQAIIDQDRRYGKRERVHDHYLKTVVWCARCRRRLVIIRGKSHNGSLYFYWLCRGRQEHACGACQGF